jgi:hypothetical protein
VLERAEYTRLASPGESAHQSEVELAFLALIEMQVLALSLDGEFFSEWSKVSAAAGERQLFRDVDRRSMRFAFDLWSHEEVSGHAGAILDRVRAGTMPCDGAWPEARVAVFERWIDSGKAA